MQYDHQLPYELWSKLAGNFRSCCGLTANTTTDVLNGLGNRRGRDYLKPLA